MACKGSSASGRVLYRSARRGCAPTTPSSTSRLHPILVGQKGPRAWARKRDQRCWGRRWRVRGDHRAGGPAGGPERPAPPHDPARSTRRSPAAAPGPGYASGPRRGHGVHDHLTAAALATEAASVVGHPGFERPTAGDGRCCWPTNCPPGTTRMLGARRTSARWPTPSPSCCWPGWLGPPTPAATGRTPTAPSAWSARFPWPGHEPTTATLRWLGRSCPTRPTARSPTCTA